MGRFLPLSLVKCGGPAVTRLLRLPTAGSDLGSRAVGNPASERERGVLQRDTLEAGIPDAEFHSPQAARLADDRQSP